MMANPTMNSEKYKAECQKARNDLKTAIVKLMALGRANDGHLPWELVEHRTIELAKQFVMDPNHHMLADTCSPVIPKLDRSHDWES